MNVDNVRAVLAAIKAAPDAGLPPMKSYYHCGTPQCIAGHAHALAVHSAQGADLNGDYAVCYTREIAQDFLGISPEDEQDLFAPDYPWADYQCSHESEPGYITKEMMVATLERLLATGEVIWVKPEAEGWLNE